jgi:transposase
MQSEFLAHFEDANFFFSGYRFDMPLPELSASERAAALEAAARARKIRAEVKADLKNGKRTLSEVIELGKKDEVIGKMKVNALLESLPGVGKVRATTVMEQVGIASSRRIRGLGIHQTRDLLAHFQLP